MAEQKRLEEQAQKLAHTSQSKSSDMRKFFIKFFVIIDSFHCSK